MRRLVPHAIVLVGVVAIVLGWDLVGLALPPVDALLAPGESSTGELIATAAMLGTRLMAVLMLPGLTAMTLVDATLVLLQSERGERREEPAG